MFQGCRLETLLIVPGPATSTVTHAKHNRHDQQAQRGDAESYGQRQADKIVSAAQRVTHDGQGHVLLDFAARVLRVADIIALVGEHCIKNGEIQPIVTP